MAPGRAPSCSRRRPSSALIVPMRSSAAARRPAEPRAVRGNRCGDEAQLHAALRRGERQLGPHVELREHERRGLERLEHGLHLGRAVERQVVRDVDRQRARQSLSRGGEERIGELPVRCFGAHGFEHRLRLEALAHRRGVHPQQRALGIAVGPCPGGQPVRHPAARIQTAGQLLVEPRGEGEGPVGEPDAEPIGEGRAPHQRGRGGRGGVAVLLW